MNASSDPSNKVSLQDVVEKIHRSPGGQTGGPTLEEPGIVCDVLFAASLLKEEGEAVRARVVIAPPGGFPPVGGPPDGIHAVRFTASHLFTQNEVKRLSPAAGFFHSALAIWPERDRGFMIWGILNTGPPWLNLVGGGRKPTGDDSNITAFLHHHRNR